MTANGTCTSGSLARQAASCGAARRRASTKIAVSGKGGAGKTTISGPIARALAHAGHDVIAIDADINPMLGISLGLGVDGTERLLGMRQGACAVASAPTVSCVRSRVEDARPAPTSGSSRRPPGRSGRTGPCR